MISIGIRDIYNMTHALRSMRVSNKHVRGSTGAALLFCTKSLIKHPTYSHLTRYALYNAFIHHHFKLNDIRICIGTFDISFIW